MKAASRCGIKRHNMCCKTFETNEEFVTGLRCIAAGGLCMLSLRLLLLDPQLEKFRGVFEGFCKVGGFELL